MENFERTIFQIAIDLGLGIKTVNADKVAEQVITIIEKRNNEFHNLSSFLSDKRFFINYEKNVSAITLANSAIRHAYKHCR